MVLFTFSSPAQRANKFYPIYSNVKLNIENETFNDGLRILNQYPEISEGRHRLVYFLEKGTLLHFQGKYKESNKWLEYADLYVETYYKKTGNVALSYLSNPNAVAYPGEDFERVFVNYYKALNYISLNRLEDALVEVKRMNILLNLNQDLYPDNVYKNDAFIHLFMGLVYDMTKEYNDAFIAYKNAHEIYKTEYAEKFNIEIPRQLIMDLTRSAKKAGLRNEYKKYSELLNEDELYEISKQSSAIFLWHNGLVPEKYEQVVQFAIVNVGGYVTVIDKSTNEEFKFEEATLKSMAEIKYMIDRKSGLYKLAFSKLVERKSLSQNAQILHVNENCTYSMQKCEDLSAIAIQSHHDRKSRMIRDAIIRLMAREAAKEMARELTKAGVESLTDSDNLLAGIAGELAGVLVGAALNTMERADLRQWSSLPADIFYKRIYLDEGEHQFEIQSDGAFGDSLTKTIKVEDGDDVFNIWEQRSTYSGLSIESFVAEPLFSEDFNTQDERYNDRSQKKTKIYQENGNIHIDNRNKYFALWFPFLLDIDSTENFEIGVKFKVQYVYGRGAEFRILWNNQSEQQFLKNRKELFMDNYQYYSFARRSSFYSHELELKKKRHWLRRGLKHFYDDYLYFKIKKIGTNYYFVFNEQVLNIMPTENTIKNKKGFLIAVSKAHIVIDDIYVSQLVPKKN